MLHRLVYGSAIAGVVHYYWLVKSDVRKPLFYGAIVAVLLGYRAVRALLKRRGNVGGQRDTATTQKGNLVTGRLGD
jgi:sulfoxide reductase heme-binding subunit YedZ